MERKGGVRQEKKKNRFSAKECRQLLQLVVCGSVFVLLVAVKLLLPGKAEVFNAKLSEVLTRSVDMQEVFSVVGQAFSGEEEARELYQIVFKPLEKEEQQAQIRLPESITALEKLQQYRFLEMKPELEGQQLSEESTEKEQGVATLAYVLYSKENVPENVSFEQSILNFDYCTPLQGTLSSDFGYREHPTEGEDRFHYGVDLAAEKGTEIQCFADGTVKAVGDSSSYGKYCIVSHGGNYSTLYAHCDRITVSSGVSVLRGQNIATVGDTGIATGPHLHFELQRDGIYLNPVYYI
jgi:murein DD-endopeptidase MepM/ murein hydrolase activator NlpD